jgi:GNAT superfamily N-acetyltransferase
MRIEILDNRHAPQLTDFLAQHLHSSLFIYSNLQRAGVLYDGSIYTGEYFALISDDEETVHGILVHYWNGMLLMQCPEREHLQWLCEYFAHYCERPVGGIIGSAKQANTCVDSLGLSDASFSVRRDEALMSLSLNALEARYCQLPKAQRIARPSSAHADLLKEWLIAYEVEAFDTNVDGKLNARIDERVRLYLEGQDGWLLIEGDTPVAFAGLNARAEDIVQVGPVWTPPAFRNRGHARHLVAGLLRGVADEGYSGAVLFTDSVAAHRAYEAIGFADTGKFALAFLEKPVGLKRAV